MAPAHHPAPELLIDYVSGAHSAAEMLLVELHLAFCAGCRRSVRVLFAAGGDLLDSLQPETLAPDAFNTALGMINQTKMLPVRPPWRKPPQPVVPSFAASWPHPLRRQVAQHHLRRWGWLPAGFRALRIPFSDRSSRVSVLKAPPGRGPFPHSHVRDEWAVVLEGGFTDETGTYNAGDFSHRGPGESHSMVAEPGEGCVCVLLARAQPVYTTWLGRLLAPFIRV